MFFVDQIQLLVQNPPKDEWLRKYLYAMDLCLVEELTPGKFSSVHKITDGKFKDYALKIFSINEFARLNGMDDITKLFRELNVMKKLGKCDNLVTLDRYWFEGPLSKDLLEIEKGQNFDNFTDKFNNDVGNSTSNTIMYLKMEYCEMNLDGWMEKYPFRTRDIDNLEETLIVQIVKGLTFIHSNKIIHRNLTPPNIFVNCSNDSFQVKIGDFSTARPIQDGNQDNTIEIGVRNFQSPEMYRGENNYDETTDVYSLGLVYLILILDWKCTDEAIRILCDTRRGDFSNISKAENIHRKNFNILRKMLKFNKIQRISAQNALKLFREEIDNI